MHADGFTEAFEEVRRTLKAWRETQSDVKDAEAGLAYCRAEAQQAEEEFNAARARFLEEFPEMAPAQVTTAVVEASPESQTATVEEAKPVPVMTPQGPVVFREMDDSPFGVD